MKSLTDTAATYQRRAFTFLSSCKFTAVHLHLFHSGPDVLLLKVSRRSVVKALSGLNHFPLRSCA